MNDEGLFSTDVIDVLCPFCFANVRVIPEMKMVLHDVPPCEELMKSKDGGDYLRKASKKALHRNLDEPESLN